MPYLYSDLLISANTTYYHDHRTSVIYSHCVFICFTVSLILFLFPPVWIGSTSTEINHADFILAQAPERLKMPWAGSCRQAVKLLLEEKSHLSLKICFLPSWLWGEALNAEGSNQEGKWELQIYFSLVVVITLEAAGKASHNFFSFWGQILLNGREVAPGHVAFINTNNSLVCRDVLPVG